MERCPDDLTNRSFDLVVVGGGILGACVARDAALRGLGVALIERDDFASGTSCNSLKIVHGGLRHLQHADLRGMRDSVGERSVWLRIAPHLVQPLPVVIPLFGGRAEHTAFRVALRINDFLSADRNRGLPSEQQISPGDALSQQQVLDLVPQLRDRGITAGVRFHDAQMYSSERLVLAVVVAAAEAGATVLNHTECVGPLLQHGQRTGLRVLDTLSGAEFGVRARVIVNSSGPGANGLTRQLTGQAPRRPATLSLAWNLVLPGLGPQVAFALPGMRSTPTGSGGKGPRRLFVVPWRGRTLLGTGHAPFHGDPESFRGMGLQHPALRAFLNEVSSSWPGPPLVPQDALLIHAGLLPADAVDATNDAGEVRLSRRSSLLETTDGGSPVLTATTVKFTTSRRLAQDAVDRTCRHLGYRGMRSRAAHTPLPGAPAAGLPALLQSARSELSGLLPDDVIEHLVRCYGTRYPQVLRWRDEDPRWSERLAEDSPVIRAQLLHGVRSEMACTPDDLLRRRTELGARGPEAAQLQDSAARILAEPMRAGRRNVP